MATATRPKRVTNEVLMLAVVLLDTEEYWRWFEYCRLISLLVKILKMIVDENERGKSWPFYRFPELPILLQS